MHDEFLHHLRKEPSPEFAARLRARLRRQAKPPLRATSRVRTLITLVLLGGTAFAITTVVQRGLPTPLVELFRHGVVRNATPSKVITADNVGNGKSRQDLWPGAGEWSPTPVPLRGSGPPYTGTSAMSPPGSPGSTRAAPSASSAVAGGAVGPRPAEISVVTSWAAYPYAAAIVEFVNRIRGGAYVQPVSVRDSDGWPGPICDGGDRDPDVAYAFAPVGTVRARPCPQNASGKPNPVVAIPVGYEAVILAGSPMNGELDLTQRDVFLALAKWIPDPAQPGLVHENTNSTWQQIDGALPSRPIEFMGPALSSATGRSMIELLMERGCNTFYWIAVLKATDPAQHARLCRTVRTDDVYSEVSSLSSASLLAQPDAVGIFGFTSADTGALRALSISRLDGVEPTLAGIESGSYPGSSGLYLYVNRQRLPNFGLLGPRLLLASPPFPAYVAPPLPQYQEALTEASAP